MRSSNVKQLPPRHKIPVATPTEERLLEIINRQTTIIKALVEDVAELSDRVEDMENA
jgi:hypothetical protein